MKLSEQTEFKRAAANLCERNGGSKKDLETMINGLNQILLERGIEGVEVGFLEATVNPFRHKDE